VRSFLLARLAGHPLWVGATIFVVAAVLRVARPDGIWFIIDQARDLEAGRAILAGRLTAEGPGIGQSSLSLGPLYYYVVAAGLLLRDQPADAFRLLAGLDALGVVLYYLLFRRMAGGRLGAAAAFVLALHPLAVLTARGIWNPSLIAPTTAPYLLGLWIWAKERRASGLALLLPASALMMQTHATTVLLLPFVLLGLVRRAPVRDLRVALGLLAAAAVTLPWLVPFVRQLGSAGIRVADRGGLAGETVSYATGVLRCLAPELATPGLAVFGGGTWNAVVTGALSAFCFLVLLGAVRVVLPRGRESTTAWILLGGILVSALVLAGMPAYLFFYYLAITWPFRSLLAVYGAALVARALGRGVAVAVVAIAVSIPSFHLAAALVGDGEAGVKVMRAEYRDLKRRWGRQRFSNKFATMGSLEAVSRVLAVELGMDRSDLIARGRGPWWSDFTAVGDFWFKEPSRHGHTAPPRSPTTQPVLIVHRDDTYLTPGPGQRLAHYAAGAFRVIAFRSGIDASSWAARPRDDSEKGSWFSCPGLLPLRSPLSVPVGHYALRTRWRGPDASGVQLQVVQGTGVVIEEVSVDGRSLACAGRWGRSGSIVHWYPVPFPTRGDHTVELHVEFKRLPFPWYHLDVFEVQP